MSIEEDEDKNFKDRVAKLIGTLTGSSSILKFEHSDDFLEILEESQSRSTIKVVKNLKRIAIESKNDTLLKAVESVDKKLDELRLAKEEAELEADEERTKIKNAEKELRRQESENLFLKSLKSQDLNEVVSFMHSVGISASSIDNYLSATYQKINRGIEIDRAELGKIIEAVSFENRKILSISRFATKANFKLFAEEVTVNLFEFISEYLINIVAPLRKGSIEIQVDAPTATDFVRTIKPIEISILLDNFVSNSIRAKASLFIISFRDNNGWEIMISDNGIGIPDEIKEKIFDFGFTTTSGSGLGLFHVKQILSNIGAQIRIDNKLSKGVRFIINFN